MTAEDVANELSISKGYEKLEKQQEINKIVQAKEVMKQSDIIERLQGKASNLGRGGCHVLYFYGK